MHDININMKFSVALATFNEEENLAKCLESVIRWTDEIVIVDGGSTDKTLNIARKFNARIIHADNPPIFHINKQKAIAACRGKWILQLDADEIVTDELKREIISIARTNLAKSKIYGYYVPRKNYFLGSWLKKGGLYPDYVIRFFKNEHGFFPSRSVHEQINIEGPVSYLQNPLIHNTAPTLASYWIKARRYITLRANEYLESKNPVNMASYIYNFIIAPAGLFISLVIRHKAILDGWRGVLFSFYSALQIPMAYYRYLNILSRHLKSGYV